MPDILEAGARRDLDALAATVSPAIAVSARDSVLTQAQRITARGGTDTALPMQQLLHERHAVDNIVLITDEQQNLGCRFVEVLDE